METQEIIAKMIDFSEGNLHDINHFMKVYEFAETIGKGEKLDDESNYSKENIMNIIEKVFKTNTGIHLIKSIYKID